MKVRESIISYIRDAAGGRRIMVGITAFFFSWAQVAPAAAAIKEGSVQQGKSAPVVVQQVDAASALQELLNERLDAVSRKASSAKTRKQTADYSTDRKAIKDLQEQLKQQDQRTILDFHEDLSQIDRYKLPDIIRQRHDEVQAKFERQAADVQAQLAAMQAADEKSLPTLARQLHARLESFKPKRPKTFDPKNLPFKVASSSVRKPKATNKELRDLLNPNLTLSSAALPAEQRRQEISQDEVALIARAAKEGAGYMHRPDAVQIASSGSLHGMLAVSAYTPPIADDTAPTMDVQITPAIQALASLLNHSPVQIYNWVHDNIEYQPTYGSIQGSDATLANLRGNAFDTASLLIALLRTSGIPARYTYGTIQVPIANFSNWVGGAADPNAAEDFVAEGGIPNAALISGGQIVAMQLEHVWVEAFVDARPSRGVKNVTPQTWVPLDAAYKQYSYKAGMSLKQMVPFDQSGLLSSAAQGATIDVQNSFTQNVNQANIQSAVSQYQGQLQSYSNSVNPSASVGDAVGQKTIVSAGATVLPSGLPYHVAATASSFSTLPANLRHTLRMEFFSSVEDQEADSPSFSVELGMPQLAGKKLTFAYQAATPNDQAVLDNAFNNNQTSFPAYQVNMVPVLKVEDQVLQTGPAYTAGTMQALRLTTVAPWYNHPHVYSLTAGDFFAISLNAAGISSGLLNARAHAHDLSTWQDPDFTGEMYHQIALSYWAEEAAFSQITAAIDGELTMTLPSVGLAGSPLYATYAYGVPRSASYGSRTLDVKELLIMAVDKHEDQNARRLFVEKRGLVGSYMEAGSFDQSFLQDSGNSMSAVTALQFANQSGVPIYTVTASNQQTVMSQLQVDSDTADNIANATASGLQVIVPRNDITVGSFSGLGYIIQDPESGAGSYLISGGRDGNSSPGPFAPYPLPQFPATPVASILLASVAQQAGALFVTTDGVVTGFTAGSAAAGTAGAGAGTAGAGALLGPVVAFLIIASVLAQASSTAIENQYPRISQIYRHYTTEFAAPLIDASKFILASAKGDFGPGVYTVEPPDKDIFCPMTPAETDIVMQRYNISGDPRSAFIEVEITRAGYWTPVISEQLNSNGAVETIFHLPFLYYGPFAVAIRPHSACY